MEFIIHHNGRDWCLKNEQFSFCSPTLEDLDQTVAAALRNAGIIQKGETRKIVMAYDNSTIPPVIRQYANHYFNRMVEVKG